jgi:hypothetical protein
MNNYYPMTAQAKRLSGSRKREFRFYTGADRPQNTASYWNGGSKTSYTVINMLTGAQGIPPCGQYPTFQASYTLRPQELLMETGVFCGKPGTARFNCRTEDEALARKFLGIEAVAVLVA